MVLQEAAAQAIPVVTTAMTAFIGASADRNRLRGGVIGGLVGLIFGGLLSAFTPKVERWVCGECGCNDVTPTA